MEFQEYPKWVTPKGQKARIVQNADEEAQALAKPAGKDEETGQPARNAAQLGAAARKVDSSAAKAAKVASKKATAKDK